MRKMLMYIGMIVAIVVTFCIPVSAKISKQEVERLGKDLTPFGAEKAGNAEGTIPEWTGGLTGVPDGIGYQGPGDKHPDPFADDNILFTIDASNVKTYGDKLNAGTRKMIEMYPDTMKVNVYPTRRTASAPQWAYDLTKESAVLCELTPDGLGLLNNGALGGVPFPIPTRGEELMFNHLLRWRNNGRTGIYDNKVVYADGKRVTMAAGNGWERFSWWDIDRKGDYDGFYYEVLLEYTQPDRRKGEYLLLKDPLNQVENPRMAWQYLPGQRRVRRAPQVAYDTPDSGAGGTATYDQAYMFNGALDRYDWKLLGKKEMYIPYNCYQADLVSEEELLTPHHLNPDHIRYELHRVWMVEATLKEGKRHAIARRIFYLDEDSWVIVMTDEYDGQDNLWRMAITTMKNAYEVPAVVQRLNQFYDFTLDFYCVNPLYNNPEKDAFVKELTVEPSFFSPEQLRRMGRR